MTISSGLTRANGSMLSVLHLMDKHTNYDLVCKLTAVSHKMAKHVLAVRPVIHKVC